MERRIRRIVVGIGEVQEEDAHLRSAIDLAEALGAQLHVVYAYRFPDPLIHSYVEANVFTPEVIARVQEVATTRLEELVRQISTSELISCHAIGGPADLVILGVAEDVGADLIVVGATRRGWLARSILGTTAQRVVRGAGVPVLVNRRSTHHAPRRILLTTDLSESSAKVYDRALALLPSLCPTDALELRTLLVLEFDFPPPPPLSERALEMGAEVELESYLTRSKARGWPSHGRIRTGGPGREIVAEATEWEADLLVLGTHGRTGASRLLIGSVAEAALRGAPCDVLVIPTASA